MKQVLESVFDRLHKLPGTSLIKYHTKCHQKSDTFSYMMETQSENNNVKFSISKETFIKPNTFVLDDITSYYIACV